MNLLPITLMLLAAGPVNPKAPASLGGVVVMAETNTPVIHAAVRLTRFPEENSDSTPDGRPQRENWPHVAKADKNGRFVFDKIPPGNYRIDVNRTSSFVLISDGPSGSLRGIPVSANPGERVSNLRVEVTLAA